jgi:AcrR family transcriptional regulator
MDADDRRDMIVEAAMPLLVEHGAKVTSKQIADAAGVAEGTMFKAFGDKESLLHFAAKSSSIPRRCVTTCGASVREPNWRARLR